MAREIQTALIIGASRGLGRGLVDALAAKGISVTGTIRNLEHLDQLQNDTPGHVNWQLLDINDTKHLDAFIANTRQAKYDVIFVNAGVSGPEHASVLEATPDETGALFQTNAISPVRLAYKLTGHLNAEHGIMAFMTSILGSVELAEGYMPLYSASKAALNSLTRAYAESVKDEKITVLSVHPGWVKTDLGGADAPLDVTTSVTGIVNVLESHVGRGGHHYVDYQGKTLPW